MRITPALLLLFAAPAALAHDFWIEPSTFRPQIGQSVTASLRVGQDFVGDAVPRSASLIESFVVRDSGGERAVGGFENQDPAGYLKIQRAGTTIIGYRSKPYPLELPAEKFEEFLRTEKLDKVAALRVRLGESGKPDRERFFRFAKSVLSTAGAPAGGYDKPLQYRLELVPETDPSALSPLRVRLLFEAKPLANALVTAINADDPSVRVTALSDAHGRVTFDLPRRGVWLVKSVQMVRAQAGSPYEWESLWASLTFER